jgi:hypothetical protein
MFPVQKQEAEAAAGFVVHNLSAVDISPVFSVIYVPMKGTRGTAATCATSQSANTITFTVDGAVPAGVDSIGTAGVISGAAAAYNTVGEIVNYINSCGAWAARCLCDPATPWENILEQAASSCLKDGGLTFYLDTSVINGSIYYVMNVPVTGNVFFNSSPGGILWGQDHAVVNKVYSIQIIHATGTMYVKQFKRGDIAATTLWSSAITNSTTALTSFNTNSPLIPLVEGTEGYTVIVTCEAAAATAATYASVVTKTVVGDGSYAITTAQY